MAIDTLGKAIEFEHASEVFPPNTMVIYKDLLGEGIERTHRSYD
jgi:hypothetical protein